MARKTRPRIIGILTAGGDCPGLNAAIRGVAKAALHHDMKVIGILDGFRGLVENRTVPIEDQQVSGVLTLGGTFLGSSRDKPHKMTMGDKVMDMTDVAIANARRLQLDCLVCLGGGGTQKNALHLHKAGGINVLTLPKTIDNDVAMTDISFGFDTALGIATEAIDRLHTTATSHHRIIVCEIMGHSAGWLTLGAGISGGADVILIPEIPYDLEAVAANLRNRQHHGKRFSIIAIAEGALSQGEVEALSKRQKSSRKNATPVAPGIDSNKIHLVQEPMSSRVARHIQQLTGLEARVTSLGHVQRGGTPSPADRLLCTRLGTKAGELLMAGVYNAMVAVRGEECVPVPLEKVAGVVKRVPANHPWVKTARLVGTCMGDVSGV